MRKWLIKVQDYPSLSPRKYYRVKITDVERERNPVGIAVTVQHLSPEQEGRSVHFTLLLPIRISGLAAEFFRACNLIIAIDKEIEPKSVIGTLLEVRFIKNEVGEYEPVEFRTIKSNTPTM